MAKNVPVSNICSQHTTSSLLDAHHAISDASWVSTVKLHPLVRRSHALRASVTTVNDR
eukprot:COSAG02_NODE_4466_length_5332_cov_3.159564_4_plen_58_part_00